VKLKQPENVAIAMHCHFRPPVILGCFLAKFDLFDLERLSRDQTLHQILAKSNDPRMSYSDFVIKNLGPSPSSS